MLDDQTKEAIEKSFVKASFHWRPSRSRSRKSASDLVKIEYRSRRRSHKLDGIGVGRIRTVPFSSDSAYDSDAYNPVKTRLSESQAEVLCLFFGFHLRLRQSSFHWIISVGVISRIGRKWNRCDSAYDSDFRFSLGRKRLRLRLRRGPSENQPLPVIQHGGDDVSYKPRIARTLMPEFASFNKMERFIFVRSLSA